MKVNDILIIERKDLTNTHEEADVIMIQQAYKSALDSVTKSIFLVRDDIDVFILLVYFYHKLGLDTKVYIQTTNDERDVLDIDSSIINCQNIIPSVLSAHAPSGCDTVAPFFGLGKPTIVNKLRSGKELKSLGDLEAFTEDILVESALLICICYRF